ncbi:MAG TPA: outer membrane lipoprotein-sorting protein [Dehalococcoidia bacterium]|nr:outer membrane lipoprotein-sorting protein [Dehalococcoidia bacterium]
MWKRIFTIPLVLIMVLSFTACTNGTGEAEERAASPSAQEIVSYAVDSLDDIKTSQFEMNMTMAMAGEAEGETFEATMVMDFNGTLDLENGRMGMDITMNVATPGEDKIEMAVATYLLDDFVYMMMDLPEVGPMWMKLEMPEVAWEEMNQVESQIGLLEASQVKIIGSETIDGIDCYVLQLTPDMEQLWQVVMQQAEVAGEEIVDIPGEFLEEVFRSSSVKQWIAKDTYFLTKAQIDMVAELTPEALGSPQEEGLVTMEIALDLLFYNYNQSVSIVLPPEAVEAIEVPIQ